jgi:hypothetical protein
MTDQLQAGPDADARIAIEWMGWKHAKWSDWWWIDGKRTKRLAEDWQPSTNAAHAGEARRKADWWNLELTGTSEEKGILCTIEDQGQKFFGCVWLDSDPDPEAAAEALAITRAIDAALTAKEKDDGS